MHTFNEFLFNQLPVACIRVIHNIVHKLELGQEGSVNYSSGTPFVEELCKHSLHMCENADIVLDRDNEVSTEHELPPPTPPSEEFFTKTNTIVVMLHNGLYVMHYYCILY